MHTFVHVTERTFDLAHAVKIGLAKKLTDGPDAGKYALLKDRLPDDSRSEFATVKGETKVKVYLDDKITVPTTAAELAALSQQETEIVEMECGKGTKVSMTLACARYTRGLKLESNQDRGNELAGDGKKATRQATIAWFLSTPSNVAVYTAKLQANTPKQMDAYLDQLYADNSGAIDEYAGQ